MKKQSRKVALMGLFIALCYLGTMFNIQIPLGGAAKAMIHFGNTFCLLAALSIGGLWGGMAGALGMGLFDLTSAGFQLYAPQTFILKFCIGIICGFAYKKLKIQNETVKIAVACTCAMVFNVICAPIGSYLTSVYLMGIEKSPASIFAAISALPSLATAAIGVIVATILFRALKPAIEKAKG